MKAPSDTARAALIARQGAGARYDAPDAPREALLLARRGTSYFARLLNGLQDDLLADDSGIAGWSRAHVIAFVSYHARGLARLLDNGVEHPSVAAFKAEITNGASLPPRALRALFQHTSIHLDVTWRDLPGRNWNRDFTRYDGLSMPARDCVVQRANVIWASSLALMAGGRVADVPDAVRERVTQIRIDDFRA